MPLTLLSLGRLELSLDGTPLLPGRRKELTVLAYLLREQSPSTSREALATLFWGDRDDRRARQSLRQALHILRQGIGEAMHLDAREVRILPGTIRLDANQFELELDGGRPEAAVGLWGGDFLLGQEDAGTAELRDWIDAERTALRRRMAGAFEAAAERAEGRGDMAAALGYAERWCRCSPLEEGAELRRLKALHGVGRHGEAVACHAAFSARLMSELGRSPSKKFARIAATLTEERTVVAIGAAGLLTPDFIGREEALAVFRRAWGGAISQSGAGGVILVDGEPGIGKSRLLSELRHEVESTFPRAMVLRARGYESERLSRGGALRHLLAPLAGAPGIRAVPATDLATLVSIIPSLADSVPGLPAAPADGSIAPAALRALAEVAAEAPCLLICDDVGSMDGESQAVLAALVRAPPPGTLLVLASRQESLEGTGLLRDVRQAAETHRIRLTALDESELKRLLYSSFPLAPNQVTALAAHLHEASGGNPGQAVSLLSLMADQGIVAPDRRGVWQISGDLSAQTVPLPVDLRDAVRARRERLPLASRRLLDSAAVFGSPFELQQLEVIAGVPRAEGSTGLGILLSRGWIREGRQGAYEFASESVRRAVYDLLPPSPRTQWHRIAHDLLRAQPGSDRTRLTYHQARGNHLRPRRLGLMVGVAVAAIGAITAIVAVRRPHEGVGTARWQPAPVRLTVMPVTASGEAAASAGEVLERLLQALSGAGLVQLTEPAVGNPGENGPASADVAATNGRRLGATALVRTHLELNGSQFVIGATLISLEDGSVQSRTSVFGSRQRLDSLIAALATAVLAAAATGQPDGAGGTVRSGTTSLAALKAYLRGERKYRAGRLLASQQDFLEAVQADSLFARAWFRRAQVADWLTEPDTALAAISRALALDSSVTIPERRLYRGFQAYLLGNYPAAETLLREALNYTPAFPDARVALGETLLHGNWTRGRSMAEAEEHFVAALTLVPSEPIALRHGGDLAYRRGDAMRGDSLFQAMRIGLPSWPRGSMIHLSTLQAFAGGDSARQARVLDTLATSPERLAVLTTWVLSLFHPVPAHLVQTATVLVDPKRPLETRGLGHAVLAYLALAIGDTGAATGHVAIAKQLTPSTRSLTAYLVLTDRLHVDDQVAEAVVAELRARRPSSAPSPRRAIPELIDSSTAVAARLYLLGLAALRRGDLMEAELNAQSLDRERTRSRGVEDNLALGLRARITLSRGDTVAAISELRESWRGIPFEVGRASPLVSRPADRVLMGDLLSRSGNQSAARGWYLTITELSPWDLAWLPEARAGIAALDPPPN